MSVRTLCSDSQGLHRNRNFRQGELLRPSPEAARAVSDVIERALKFFHDGRKAVLKDRTVPSDAAISRAYLCFPSLNPSRHSWNKPLPGLYRRLGNDNGITEAERGKSISQLGHFNLRTAK